MGSDAKEVYRAAWAAWRRQIDHLHRVLLEDEPASPAQLKGLLGREARAKEAYDRARAELLGLSPGTDGPRDDGGNPFRRA